MLSARQASAIEESAWFQARWAPYLLADADLRIRAVNAAYEGVSMHPRDSAHRTLSTRRHWPNCGSKPAPDIPRVTDRIFR